MAQRSSNASSGWGAKIVLLLLAVALVFGVVQLLRLRFDAGDVYRPYSSFRADPLGTKVLYESLDALPGVDCHRGMMNLDRMRLEQAGSFLVLGTHPRALEYRGWIEDEEFKALQGLVLGGARVVFTITPSRGDTLRDRRGVEEEKDDDEELEDKEEDEEIDELDLDEELQELLDERYDTLSERWAIGVKPQRFFKTNRKLPVMKAVKGGSLEGIELPAWRSNTHFIDLEDSGWEILATIRERPVVVERKFGKGSVVMIADSYFVSNQAMRQHRSSEFLAWMIGGGGDVYFDETHHGVRSEPGIMNLARRYRLHGLFIGAALFFGLLIWRSSSSLVPTDLDRDFGIGKDGAVSGEGAASGFARLLHRGISKSDVLRYCVAVWENRRGLQRGLTDAQRAEVQDLANSELAVSDPAIAYQKVTQILHRKANSKESSVS